MAKKHMIDCEDMLWREVQKYKINMGLRTNNEAVVDLIKKGLTGEAIHNE